MNAQTIFTAASKLGLVIALLLALAAQTDAALTIRVDGSPVGSEITIAPGDTVIIGVYDSAGTFPRLDYLNFYYISAGNFSLSNPSITCDETSNPCYYAMFWDDILDYIEFEIFTGWTPTEPPPGPGLIFEVDLECIGLGDVIIDLVSGTTFEVLDRLTIHQVEPPPLYGPRISINGVAINGVSEITVDTGTTISIGIHDDLGNAPPDAFTAYLDFDPNDPLLYTLSNPQLGAAAGDAAAFTGPDPTATANQYQIDQAWSAATPSIGSIFTVDYKVETEGDTVINLWDSRTGLAAPVDTMTIHQVYPPCWFGDESFQNQWLFAGYPDCWCKDINPRQCLGDATNSKQGRFLYAVSTEDLKVLTGAWNKQMIPTLGTGTEGDGLTNGTHWICADFDHLPQGAFQYRVSTNDLDILAANWNIANGPADDICQDIIGDQTP